MIPEYYYKKTEPGNYPKILIPELEKCGIDISRILLCVPLDRDTQGNISDFYLISDGDSIYTVCGIVSAVIQKHKSTLRTFNKTGFSSFPLSVFRSFDMIEEVSSLALVGRKEDGDSILLSLSSLSRRREMMSAKEHLEELLTSGIISVPSGEEDDCPYCPKCGTRYADPSNKLCSECMDRKRVLDRTWDFFKKYKMMVALIILMLILTGLVEIVTPLVSERFFYDEVLSNIESEYYGRILLVVFMIVGVKLISTVVSSVQNVVTSIISSRISYDLKKTIFSSIQRLSVSFFTSRKTGGLMTQVNSDANTIYWFFCDGVPFYLVNIAQIIAVTVIMFVMNPLLAAVSMICMPGAYIVTSILRGKMRIYHIRRFTKSRSMNGLLTDILGGIRVVKAFAKENDETVRFVNKSEESAKTDKEASDYAAKHNPIVGIITSFNTTLIWGIGGYMVMKNTFGMTYGMLAAFVVYMMKVYNPMLSLVSMVSQTTDSFNAMARLVEVMDAIPDVVEKEAPITLEDPAGSVEFRDVTFGYDVSKNVLKHISFKVEAGQSIGIVGHTGAGKSTLANLLIRLYDTKEGGIYIDGVNVRDLSFDSLRKNTAIVSQETYLFIGTVYENIAYGCGDATPEDVIYAAKIAGAHEFISKLPEGYETMIGMGYTSLSGGERQRISIARAILKKPKILILDEATAAMDTKTERGIQEALEKLTKGRTTIMIAHRLSTLRDVDKLIVIENGEIAEEGSHEKLIREKGIYFRLYTLQLEAMKNIGVEG